MTEIVVHTLPYHVAALVEPSFEEKMCILPLSIVTHALDSGSISILTSHLTGQATSSIYTIPPPAHLSLLITMLVHPSTTDTPLRRQSAHLLSRVLDVASPRAAKFDQVWTFARKRKRRGDDSDSEDDLGILDQESLFSKSEGVWHVIEWSFFKGQGGWVDILNHLVRVLRNDFDECKRGMCVCVMFPS